jgi:hypothetical protein
MASEGDREIVLRERDHRRLLRGGLGLYDHEQCRNATAFQFYGQIVIGAIVAAFGLFLVWGVWKTRLQEISIYGRADSHYGSLVFSFAVVVIGAFMAHPGLIYCWRKLSAHRGESN